MKNQIGLKDHDIKLIQETLKAYSSVEKAILYGSRAKGNFRIGSDIDLCLVGKNLTTNDLLKIENDIDDLLLPYSFDISIFHQIANQDLIDHIERVGIDFLKI